LTVVAFGITVAEAGSSYEFEIVRAFVALVHFMASFTAGGTLQAKVFFRVLKVSIIADVVLITLNGLFL